VTHNEITLWSGLVQREWRKEYYCPEGVTVTTEEFASELSEEIERDRIPANVSTRVVNWDGTGTSQTRVLVRYVGDDAPTDIVRCMVGVDQMGKYAYVEGKTYFAPPDLPPVKKEKKEVPDPNWLSTLGWLVGGNALFLAFLGLQSAEFADGNWVTLLFCVGPTALFALASWVELYNAFDDAKKRPEIEKWNAEVDRQVAKRRKKWKQWQKTILTSAYLSQTDDTLGRFVQAIKSTIDRVTERLFVERNAELREQSESQRTREEIEEELERRRAEAFA
jgi:hypothetical protein